MLIDLVVERNDWAKALVGRPGVHVAAALDEVMAVVHELTTDRADIQDQLRALLSARLADGARLSWRKLRGMLDGIAGGYPRNPIRTHRVTGGLHNTLPSVRALHPVPEAVARTGPKS